MAVLKREDDVVPRTSDFNALLGRGSEFEGKLTFEGTVHIEGKFTGEIFTKDTLVVREGARVQAEITAGTVVINGEVNGNIRATNSVEMHQPARVKGNVECPSLVIEKGVIFEGGAKMENLGKGNVTPIKVVEEKKL